MLKDAVRDAVLRKLHRLCVGYTTPEDFTRDDMGLGEKFTYDELLTIPVTDLLSLCFF